MVRAIRPAAPAPATLPQDRVRGIFVAVFDHVGIRVSDQAASEAAYDALFATLGVEKVHSDDELAEWDNDFDISPTDPEHPVTRNLHIAFWAPSEDEVQRFWDAGRAAGCATTARPGRGRSTGPTTTAGSCSIPTATASRRYGGPAAPAREDRPPVDPRRRPAGHEALLLDDRAARRGSSWRRRARPRPVPLPRRHVLVRPGEPTIGLHLAFRRRDNATVDEFHRVAIDAGYLGNGEPGERPVYHPGYYGAFVLDPDGTNVEAVNHNR